MVMVTDSLSPEKRMRTDLASGPAVGNYRIRGQFHHAHGSSVTQK